MGTGTLDVTLRLIPGSEADQHALAALINAAFAVYPFLTVPRTSPEGVAEELGDSGEVILAEAAGELVACAMIRPSTDVDWDNDETDIRANDAMYLGLVAVAPRAMKLGLGRRIVAEAERLAGVRGFRRMVLGTLVEMGNVDYYQRASYRVAAHEDFAPGHWGMTIPHRFCAMVKEL